MFTGWQWRRHRQPSFYSSSFKFPFSSHPTDPSGFSTFSFSFSHRFKFSQLALLWFFLSYPTISLFDPLFLLQLDIVSNTLSPFFYPAINQSYQDLNIFRTSGNVTVVRSKIHKMKGNISLAFVITCLAKQCFQRPDFWPVLASLAGRARPEIYGENMCYSFSCTTFSHLDTCKEAKCQNHNHKSNTTSLKQ